MPTEEAMGRNSPTVNAADLCHRQGSSIRVLLLDDDPKFTELIEAYLAAESIEVIVVPNGAEGLRQIMRSDFDVIVCDLKMPHLAGDRFYLAVARVKPHLCERFLFITGFGRNKALDWLSEIANPRVMYKPFHMLDLLLAINDIARARPRPDGPSAG